MTGFRSFNNSTGGSIQGRESIITSDTEAARLLVHGQVTIIFVVSVCLSVCLFVQFFSAVFDPISIKLGHMLYVCLVVSPRI